MIRLRSPYRAARLSRFAPIRKIRGFLHPFCFHTIAHSFLIYLLSFHAIAHSFPQRSHRNFFLINHFRTLSHAMGGGGYLLWPCSVARGGSLDCLGLLAVNCLP
jgi:hypothetical protein